MANDILFHFNFINPVRYQYCRTMHHILNEKFKKIPYIIRVLTAVIEFLLTLPKL